MSVMKEPARQSSLAYFLAAIICAAVIYYPSIDYQIQLSQGDHGLNLYAAEAVLRGEIPYKDFHWFYGPLMPYYYAVFFALFGTSIKSLLIGKAVLMIASSGLIFLTLRLICSVSIALLGALFFFFFQNDFFYTYDHIGGIALNLATVYFLCLFLKIKDLKHLRISLLFTFLLGLVKLNLGVASLVATLIVIAGVKMLSPKESRTGSKKTALTSIIALPAGWIIANGVFLTGLPFYIIKQNFQYFGNDASTAQYPSILQNIITLIHDKYIIITFSALDIFLCVLIMASFFFLLKDKEDKDPFVPFLFCFGIFYLLQLHEYLISGVFFRSFWADSFVLLFVFSFLGYLEKKVRPFVRIAIIFFLVIQLSALIYKNNTSIIPFKTKLSHLNYKKADIYVGNSFEWRMTVSKTLDFIARNVGENELFFAAPYDPLYYFLADRRSPTRQLVFFDFLNIPEDQEKNIIAELEANNVNWVFLSSRVRSEEPGLGRFGQTNSPLLAQYIKSNFVKVEEYGQWTHAAGWTTDTGMRIYKRK